MDNEPTVWDYVKAKILFWKRTPLHFPGPQQPGEVIPASSEQITEESREKLPPGSPIPSFSASLLKDGMRFPWRTLAAFGIAWIAQRGMEPPNPLVIFAVVLYIAAFAMLIWAFLSKELELAPDLLEGEQKDSLTLRWKFILFGFLTGAVTYLAFGSHNFTPITVIPWIVTIILFILGFIPSGFTLYPLWEKVKSNIARPKWTVTITWSTILIVLIIGVILFFRAYKLDLIPLNMTSDHAEKLLDVQDVLNGQTSVFFTRNTGREAIQFYLTAAIIRIFHTGITFLSLKLGMLLAGLLTLPFIYLLGIEFGSKRAGILATLFAGIAYWPNVIGRLGLRFALEPLFVAPAIYFLLRGLRRKNRWDFIWSGLALGVGLHGYSPIRILPFVLVIAILIYMAHKSARGNRMHAVLGLVMIAAISLAVFLPLLRYSVDFPEQIVYRTFTRVGETERAYPGPVLQIFGSNLWNAMTMFGYSDGTAWVHSIPMRPALDVVSACLFYLGMVLFLLRYIQKRNWRDLFLLLSIPLLMMPSILSLAFPVENPSLNRTAGAIVPVFLIIGLMFDSLIRTIEKTFRPAAGKIVSVLFAALLIFPVMNQNYDLVFNQYNNEYLGASGNTGEMGEVIKDFATSVGTPDTAWVVGYPYWVDTRLVSITAGYPIRDYAIWPDEFSATRNIAGPKLFIINRTDTTDLAALETMYPNHILKTYTSKIPDKDFLILLVLDSPISNVK